MNKSIFLFLLFLLGCDSKYKLSEKNRVVILNRIAELKTHFNYVKDSFTNFYWYQPKIDTSSLKDIITSKIYMDVKDDGSYKFFSIYIGGRYIDHNQVKFNINDTIYETPVKDSIDKYLLKRQLFGGIFLERLCFDNTNDNEIPEKIYNSHGQIRVIFCGSHSDLGRVTLNEKEIQKIKDAYEMSQLLKRIHKK